MAGLGVAGGWWCCAKAKEKCDLEDCDRMDVSWEKSTVCCHHVNSISLKLALFYPGLPDFKSIPFFACPIPY